MDDNTIFRFPLMRTLPLVAAFLFLLIIIAGGFFVGGYHPLVTVILWVSFASSGWLALSDLLTLATIREDGLQVRSLTLRGLDTHLLPWEDIQEINLTGHTPDVLQLRARQDVSIGKWLLPAHIALAEIVVQKANLQPDKDNKPPRVNQAFDTLLQTKGKRKKYGLFWRWKRVERELDDE